MKFERILLSKEAVHKEWMALEKDRAELRARIDRHDRLIAFLRASGLDAWTRPRTAMSE